MKYISIKVTEATLGSTQGIPFNSCIFMDGCDKFNDFTAGKYLNSIYKIYISQCQCWPLNTQRTPPRSEQSQQTPVLGYK